jgi:hypothetical protein
MWLVCLYSNTRQLWPRQADILKLVPAQRQSLGKFRFSQVIYGFGDFQTARHLKKALAAGIPARMNGLDKKLPRIKLRGCDYVGVFVQFPVVIYISCGCKQLNYISYANYVFSQEKLHFLTLVYFYRFEIHFQKWMTLHFYELFSSVSLSNRGLTENLWI